MKEGIWAKDINATSSVAGTYLVKEKKALSGRTGKPYLLVRVMDRSGEVEARIWDRVDQLGPRFRTGDVVWVSGDALSYQGSIQIKIRDLRRCGRPARGDLKDFVPGYVEERVKSEARLSRLMKIVHSVSDEALRGLLESFFLDDALREGWLAAPAAKNLHHARLGGLLEHTLSVCELAALVCDHYPQLDRDLLLTGAVLHDVGKIRELHPGWRPDYTTEGRLIGHLVLGIQMLEEKLGAAASLSEDRLRTLKHMILSHHGLLEYGSPKRPKTLEALVLNLIDDLDAKFDAFAGYLEKDRQDGESWSPYHPLFDRYLYRGQTPDEDNGEEK